MIAYRAVQPEEIDRALFAGFIRRQVVVQCRRREKDQWVIKEDPFIDDWSEEEYQELISCLKHTLQTGGFVYGAFQQGILKGFVSVEAGLFGSRSQYADLSSIHISEDMRRRGIGSILFRAAKEWAKTKGAKKLYISAHSAVESQAFYQAMGCTEAEEYNQKHVEKEPYDCQLECSVE
ncbi:MAG: GNAT family N-acetyltransferase [Lachnospiraceae bacterium]|jgi:ribosomal protein S18 acetylase RimI-like enzyme|nr:GNAT family N-acetyltransferase [Lachnospiraceae bacterium]